MTSITSAAHFRQRVIRYAEKHGVTAASVRHRVSSNAIYECRAKYDGRHNAQVIPMESAQRELMTLLL